MAAVDVEGTYLILGKRVTNNPNDKKELVPTVESVAEENRTVSDVSADTGYFSEDTVQAIELENGPRVYVAVENGSHHKTVKNLKKINSTRFNENPKKMTLTEIVVKLRFDLIGLSPENINELAYFLPANTIPGLDMKITNNLLELCDKLESINKG